MDDNIVFIYKRTTKKEGIILLIMSVVFLLVSILGLIFIPEAQQSKLSFLAALIIFLCASLFVFVEAISNLRNNGGYKFVIYEDKVVCNWPKGINKKYKSHTSFDMREAPLSWFKGYFFVVGISIMYIIIFTDFYNKYPVLWPCSIFIALLFSMPAFVYSEKKVIPFKGFSVFISDIRYIVSTGSPRRKGEHVHPFEHYITTYDELVFRIPTEYGNPIRKIIRHLIKMNPKIKKLHHSHISLEETI